MLLHGSWILRMLLSLILSCVEIDCCLPSIMTLNCILRMGVAVEHC